MSNIIVNAPIQNRDFHPDHSVGKLIPIFVADWLRQKQAVPYEYPVVDLWNNVLASEGSGISPDAYVDLASQRLEEKYTSELLSVVRRSHDRLQVQTDTDSDFTEWSKGMVIQSLENGTIQEMDKIVIVCNSCDATIADAGSPCDKGCVGCGVNDTRTETRSVLITTVDRDTEIQVDQATGTTHVEAEPRTTLLNRKRQAGISLEHVGFAGEMLDPRVGLGLLAVHTALTQNAEAVNIIASRQTLRQNLSYYYASMGQTALELPAIHMIGIAKAPVLHIAHLRDEGVLGSDGYEELLTETLPPHLLTMRRDMSPQTLERIIYSRKSKA